LKSVEGYGFALSKGEISLKSAEGHRFALGKGVAETAYDFEEC
jgi:hypothetical protein